MRFTIKLLFTLVLGVSLISGAWAAEDKQEDYPTCYVSGERWDTSSTRVEVIFMLDAEYVRGKFLNLAYMLMAIELFSEQGYNIETVEIKMLDYSTFGSEKEEMLKLNEYGSNIFIVLTENELAGSAEPFMAAFASIEEADAALKDQEFSGEVMSWDKAIDKLVQAMLSEEQGMPEGMRDF